MFQWFRDLEDDEICWVCTLEQESELYVTKLNSRQDDRNNWVAMVRFGQNIPIRVKSNNLELFSSRTEAQNRAEEFFTFHKK